MSVTVKIVVAMVYAALVAHVVTMLDFHDEQDQCSFGPVSNARYRELLSQAERYQRWHWPLVIWSEGTLQQLLNEQFGEMTKETDSASEKIATMHAMFRSIGADFLYTEPNNAFSQAADRGGSVSFGYHIDVNRLALLWPFGRTGWLIGSLAGPPQSSLRGEPKRSYERPQGQLRFIAYYPVPIDPIPKLTRGPSSCPDFPNRDLEPFFKSQAD